MACSPRSEEHTSELQSPCNLVCRLLLEKKQSCSLAGYLSAGRLVTATFNPAPPVAGLASVSPPLALLAIMRAALCDQCSPDGRPASHARLAGTLVNAVLELEKAAAAFGIHVVGNRGAAFLDGLR